MFDPDPMTSDPVLPVLESIALTPSVFRALTKAAGEIFSQDVDEAIAVGTAMDVFWSLPQGPLAEAEIVKREVDVIPWREWRIMGCEILSHLDTQAVLNGLDRQEMQDRFAKFWTGLHVECPAGWRG